MLSRAATLSAAVWIGGWLRREVPADDLLDHLTALAPDAPARLIVADRQPVPMVGLLLALSGCETAWVLLPRPGSPAPAPLASMTDGPVIVGSAGMDAQTVLWHGPSGWRMRPLEPGSLSVLGLSSAALTPRAARRELDSLLSEASARLMQLGLDRPASTRARSSWVPTLSMLPATMDAGAAGIIHRSARVLDALDTALAEEGAAVTAAESQARRAELRSLSGALQDLLVATVGGLAAAGSRPASGEIATEGAHARLH